MMSERFYMYSCILHKEMQKEGANLKTIARKMGLPLQLAEELLGLYTAKFEVYHALTLNELIKVRKKRAKLLAKTRVPLAEKALSMPINKKEAIQRLLIKEKVDNDTYLPKGYRKTDNKPRIVDNFKNYE